MFARLFAIASLAAFAVATSSSVVARDGQCNTGSISCCNSVQGADEVSQVLGLFGLTGVLAGVTGQVAMTCQPMTAVGTSSGADCQQQPVCCNGNRMNGLINIGCTPINIKA